MRQQKPSHYTRWTLLFSEPQAAWMIEEAARLGITIGEMVRRIIDEKRLASGQVRSERVVLVKPLEYVVEGE
jgi:fructosamine-3-kinase